MVDNKIDFPKSVSTNQGNKVQDLYKLNPDHVVYLLLKEHEMILVLLDKLEHMIKEVLTNDRYDSDAKAFIQFTAIMEKLNNVEQHEEREENVLFPELEKHGMEKITRVLNVEHSVLHYYKHELLELSKKVGSNNFTHFKKSLQDTGPLFITFLKKHIQKENNDLFSHVLDVEISETELERMKTASDNIGYINFTNFE